MYDITELCKSFAAVEVEFQDVTNTFYLAFTVHIFKE